MKLATTFRRLCRLRHEYSVYAHLKNANVKCIPRVFGFYQDAQRGAGALILSNDGRSLGGRPGKLTADEKYKALSHRLLPSDTVTELLYVPR